MNTFESSWPVCGKCHEVAMFSWLGGPHRCVTAEQLLAPADLVVRMNRIHTTIHPSVVRLSGRSPGIGIAIAMQWNSGFSSSIRSLVNSTRTPAGGTHEEGFEAAVSSALSSYARHRNLLRSTEPNFYSGEVCEGLAAVIAIDVDRPVFDDEAETKLANPEVRSLVKAACKGYLSRWLIDHPAEAKCIVRKVFLTSDGRRMPRRSRCYERRWPRPSTVDAALT